MSLSTSGAKGSVGYLLVWCTLLGSILFVWTWGVLADLRCSGCQVSARCVVHGLHVHNTYSWPLFELSLLGEVVRPVCTVDRWHSDVVKCAS